MNADGTRPAARESRAWRVAYWVCQLLFWGVYVALGLAMVLPHTGPQPVVLGGYGLFLVYSILLSHALRGLIRRRDWLALTPGRAACRIGAAAVALGVVLAILIIVVQAIWTRTSPLAVRPEFLVSMSASTTAACVVWAAVYTGAASLVRARRARHDAIALELDMREARLKALEAQIGPHFLFNCLNSLRGMIAENPAVAQDMVTRLANILRHNLARRASPTESLGAQAEFTTDYLALEGVRFEERLRTRLELAPATLASEVPAMLLQTLVENAIKHGLAHLPEGGEIAIASREDGDAVVVTVENTGRLRPSPAGSTRVGLANLRERLRVLHGPAATLELAETPHGTVRATARIPRPARA